MNGRQASGSRRRWSEAFLGGVAGLGARMLLAGASRLLGFKRGPVAVLGGVAGVVGALVGGGLARRERRSGLEPPAEGTVKGAFEGANAVTALVPKWEAHPEEEPPPRRGPNGRERFERHEGRGRHELGRARGNGGPHVGR